MVNEVKASAVAADHYYYYFLLQKANLTMAAVPV